MSDFLCKNHHLVPATPLLGIHCEEAQTEEDPSFAAVLVTAARTWKNQMLRRQMIYEGTMAHVYKAAPLSHKRDAPESI